MPTNFVASIAILKQAQRELRFGQLISQLTKDFGLANSYINLPPDMSPKEVHDELHERLYVLLMEDFTRYLNLLYVIDIPETLLKKIQPTDPVEVAAEMSFLILQRELQKISLRSNYS